MSDYKDAIPGYKETIERIHNLEENNPVPYNYWAETAKVINEYHPKRLQLRVSEIIAETATSKTLRLVSTDGYLPPFQAGQYINLFVDIEGITTSRAFAISSSPNTLNHYDLTIRKIKDGFISQYLVNDVQVGQEFISTGPMGNFYYNPIYQSKNVVFLAGGSGVAPAMSMIRELVENGDDKTITLIYGSMNLDDIIFKNELDQLANEHSSVRVEYVVTNPPENYQGYRGFISADIIQDILEAPEDNTFFVCGPQIMYGFAEAELRKLNIKRRNIKFEANGPPSDPSQEPGWPEDVNKTKKVKVTVTGGKSFETEAGEPLLNALERNGIVMESACRSGECSLCRCKVVKGEVFEPKQAHVRKSDKQYGYVHSCVTFAVGDIDIEIQ
ncbi:2Fe-2S iron-sulfur cluster binding domain-containing protein [Pseudomaricurvus alkylphenolicus]|uniref:2Fe-2S iron-sulfur cluster-binding protein n=1 Tax=Pseudomaricurvus alkylphenolicus TaxID=1306991 RepID=UPI001420E599|nr:2Fe-2S iron-sulfur cluster-binding protein [Pseudomaricurvus alkylphenolicus]NIB42455.1 2Fe-2S iron-sulfur cluster binding domain-containing protein [Pseudomaricurvus alkylphenolicus]